MAKFLIEINTDNSAYTDELHEELADNLRSIITKLQDNRNCFGLVKDTNGNITGSFYLQD
jgi:hypothetical protein